MLWIAVPKNRETLYLVPGKTLEDVRTHLALSLEVLETDLDQLFGFFFYEVPNIEALVPLTEINQV